MMTTIHSANIYLLTSMYNKKERKRCLLVMRSLRIFNLLTTFCLGNFYFNVSNSSFTFRNESGQRQENYSLFVQQPTGSISTGSKQQNIEWRRSGIW